MRELVFIADKHKGPSCFVAEDLFYQVWFLDDLVSVDIDDFISKAETLPLFCMIQYNIKLSNLAFQFFPAQVCLVT